MRHAAHTPTAGRKPIRREHARATRASQRGIATLVVVMVLFFVISLVAAYTSRNLIFEQRTSANQYRATQAYEAAEAGVEWALAMLNHGRIDINCNDSTSTGDSSFRERYLDIDRDSGTVLADFTTSGDELLPSCVWNGTGWTCSCPTNGAPALTAPSGAAVHPAFRLRFVRIGIPPPVPPAGPMPPPYAGLPAPSRPGVVWLQVVGCTRLDNACLTFRAQSGAVPNPGLGTTNEGRAVVSVMVALAGNAASPPSAALTARRTVDFTGAATVLANTRSGDSGITVQAGGTVTPGLATLQTAPGTPGSASIVENDPALSDAAFTADRMFAAVFKAWPPTFRQQPAVVRLACSPCVAADVVNAVSLNPGRPIWAPGGLDVNSAGDIGSANDPVVLVVDGNFSFSGAGAGATVWGLVYVRNASWTVTGGGRIEGAVVAEDIVDGTGTTTVNYRSDVLRRARNTVGSMVRVPGSWKDFVSGLPL